MQPNIGGVQRRVRAADEGFQACVAAAPGTPPQCEALAALMRAAARQPGAAAAGAGADRHSCRSRPPSGSPTATSPTRRRRTFQVIVNPLVTWMWIGGLIALAGALIAIWPTPRPPPRRPRAGPRPTRRKEAKYREIRDAELDHAAGKLSDEDFALLDAELRREAVEILDGEATNGVGATGTATATAPRRSRKRSTRPDRARLPAHVHVPQRHPGDHRRRPDLPHPPALGQGRGPLRRLRHRRRRQLASAAARWSSATSTARRSSSRSSSCSTPSSC